ncbi:MAG: hypothetical protein ACOH2F_13950 [Cellulomonas sp.]
MSDIAARSVVEHLFHAGRVRAIAQMGSPTRAPGSSLLLWAPRRAEAASFVVVALVAVAVFGAMKLVLTWLADPPGAGAGAVVVALLCGLVASVAVWRREERRADRMLYADLQFAQRCVSATRARVRAAAPTVPLAAVLLGPVDRAYDEVRGACLTLRRDRNYALRGMGSLGAAVEWERLIRLAHLEVLTAAVIAADEAVAMVASVSLAPVALEAPGPRADSPFATVEILEVLSAALG